MNRIIPRHIPQQAGREAKEGGNRLPPGAISRTGADGVDIIGLSSSDYLSIRSELRSIFFSDPLTKRSDANIVTLALASPYLNNGWELTGNAAKGIALYPEGTVQSVLIKAYRYFGKIWSVYVNPAFQFLIKTDNAGITNSTSIGLPMTGTFDVDWGDGETETITGAWYSDLTTHNYGVAGEYVIKITGALEYIRIYSQKDVLKFLAVQNWGGIAWTSLAYAFYGCENLQVTATDSPDLSGCTSFNTAFYNCDLITDGVFSEWDTGNITDFYSAFSSCALADPDVTFWDTSNATTIQNFFNGSPTFNRNLGELDIGSITTAKSAMSNTGMTAENYSKTLIGWANQVYARGGPYNIDASEQWNRTYNSINYGGTPFNNSVDARAYLVGVVAGWTITGDSAL